MILSRMYFFIFLIKIKLTLLYKKMSKKKEKSSHATLKVSGNVIVIRRKKVLDVLEFFISKKSFGRFEFFSKKVLVVF